MKFRARWTWPWGPPFVVRLRVLFCFVFLPPNVSLTRPFASHRIAPPIDHSRIGHLTQCVRYTHNPSSMFPANFLTFVVVQGWSSVIPRFSIVDFFSFYIELPVMVLMYFLWLLVRRVRHIPASATAITSPPSPASPLEAVTRPSQPFFDFVDVTRVDLYHDEHEDGQVDKHEDEARAQRLRGRARWAWAVYYLVA